MSTTLLCLAMLSSAVSVGLTDAVDADTYDGMSFVRFMMIWTLMIFLIGLVAGASLWSTCCSTTAVRPTRIHTETRVMVTLNRYTQTDQVHIAPPVIMSKPAMVYNTPRGDKMHFDVTCNHIRGRAGIKSYDVCIDCRR